MTHLAPRSLIVEADGGARGNPGPAAYGALVRDGDSGAVLAERAEAIGVASNNVAEYRGLIAGLEAAAQLSAEAAIEVRMDSKLVVEQMSGRWKIKHPDMRQLALQARRVIPSDRVRYTWVPREANSAADALVNEALDRGPVNRGGTAAGNDSSDGEPALRASQTEPGSVRTGVPGFSAMGDPTGIWLLRHGETPLTAQRRFSGRGGADPDLTELGQAQAAAAASALSGKIDVIISSPLRRTQQTAAAVASTTGIDVAIEAELAECGFGEWDGLTFAEVQERWPQEMAQWLADADFVPPGGESFTEVASRAAAVVRRSVAAHPGRQVLLVAHSTIIKSLVRLALVAPAESVFRMQLLPGSITRIDIYDDGSQALRSFAVDSHLP